MSVQVLDEATRGLADGYRIDNRIARVHAMLDCRRDPAWIAERLR